MTIETGRGSMLRMGMKVVGGIALVVIIVVGFIIWRVLT